MNIEPAREHMIYQQVRPWNVLNEHVLETLASVPRERFVPERYRDLAFADTEIPLPCEQSMLKPVVEGRLLQALAAQAGNRVLVIGTGSGFLTACAAAMSDQVTSLDIHAELVDTAAATLADEKIRNVELHNIDFNEFVPNTAFDRILVTGAMPLFDARLPEWLNDAGRLVLITGAEPSMKAELVIRAGEQYSRRGLFETVVPLLENVPQPQAFQL
jgi:protein-L-isoaspartate(D-aspartate) O-methyltransferase